jgi:hypothetical protein
VDEVAGVYISLEPRVVVGVLLTDRNTRSASLEAVGGSESRLVPVAAPEYQPKLTHRLHHNDTDLVSVPKLADDEELFSLDKSLIQSPLQALARFGLVSIVARGIEHSVTGLDCLVHGVGADVIGNFPKALVVVSG